VRERFRVLGQDIAPLRERLLERAGAREAGIVAALGGPGPLEGTLRFMSRRSPECVAHDALADRLPLDDGSVQLVAAELTLMWLEDPPALVSDVHRVLAPGGRFVITAEPNFHGVMDHPPAAGPHGLIAGVLRKRGADPEVGRRLRTLFRPALWQSELFIHPPDPLPGPEGEDLEDVVRAVRAMLGGEVHPAVLERWEEEIRAASMDGTLLMYVPYFALIARKAGAP
jgi:SAM-dependent methyltransferase